MLDSNLYTARLCSLSIINHLNVALSFMSRNPLISDEWLMNVNKQHNWCMHVRIAAVLSQLKMNLLYTHYIPGQIFFPFCCWAGLKSVSLPKMKPHTGLHANRHMQTYFHQWGNIYIAAAVNSRHAFYSVYCFVKVALWGKQNIMSDPCGPPWRLQ